MQQPASDLPDVAADAYALLWSDMAATERSSKARMLLKAAVGSIRCDAAIKRLAARGEAPTDAEAIDALAAQPASTERTEATKAEPVVDYCSECSHIGSVQAPAVACCPDSRPRPIDPTIAQQAKAGFAAMYLATPPSADSVRREALEEAAKLVEAEIPFIGRQQLADRIRALAAQQPASTESACTRCGHSMRDHRENGCTVGACPCLASPESAEPPVDSVGTVMYNALIDARHALLAVNAHPDTQSCSSLHAMSRVVQALEVADRSGDLAPATPVAPAEQASPPDDAADARRWRHFINSPGEWNDVSSQEIADYINEKIALDDKMLDGLVDRRSRAETPAPAKAVEIDAMYLIQAWGESDLPIAFTANDRDGVREALATCLFGAADQADAEEMDEHMALFDDEDAWGGGRIDWKFEIGGMAVTKLRDAAVLNARAEPQAAGTEGA